MPNTKLIFVKLMLSLADDPRFVMELNDSQKLDYLLLLLMAGLTHNDIPQDVLWFKSRFHLEKSELELKQNLEKIKQIFNKFIAYKGKYKFRNFKVVKDRPYLQEKIKDEITQKVNGICQKCGKKGNIKIVFGCYHRAYDEANIAFQIHHIIPIKKNGKNKKDNLILLCKNCHTNIHRII